MKLALKIWRQPNRNSEGHFVQYSLHDVSPEISFLEMLDLLNEKLVVAGEPAIAFDHDCREGICGACSLVINGDPHGPQIATTCCQLRMRYFREGETIVVEPFRAKAFPIIQDLIVDRSSLDRVIESGGYVSTNVGSAAEGNAIPIAKTVAEAAMDAAACIGCGACVAACRNGSAALFLGAKLTHLRLLPQGSLESNTRTLAMVQRMQDENFGSCSAMKNCHAACPKEISIQNISDLNRAIRTAFLAKL